MLENKKYDETVDATHILDLERKISQRYLFLARILHGHQQLEQECILTAFSMNPTAECFELVCKLAESNQKAANETASHPNTSQSESIDALYTITSVELLLNSKDYDVLQAPNSLLDSLTCLSEGVRSDLVSLLTIPRIKNLNWLLSWPDLEKECQALLDIEKKRQIVENTTAAANDKLKYIKLNYDDFKDFTPHEYPGIEKGYEIYVADSDSSESFLFGNASGNDSEDTDTAPESKQFIVKEAKRLRDRKRRLIKRSQKLLEESEIEAQIKKENDGVDQQQKKKRKATRMNSDCLKPRTVRRRQLKKQKSGEDSNDPSAVRIKIEPGLDAIEPGVNVKIETDIGIKIEPDVDIKIEPNVDQMQYSDEDVAQTFANLSNLQNDANFSLIDNFYSDPANPTNLTEITVGNDFQCDSALNPEQLAELVNCGYLPVNTSNHNDPATTESTTTTTTTANNPEHLVDSSNFDHSKNDIDGQTFHSIYDGGFDDDHKLGLQFQNIVGILDIPYLPNETINMQTELDTDEAPVLTELCPLKQTPIDNNICTSTIEQVNHISSSKVNEGTEVNVTFGPPDHHVIQSATNLPCPKPKNPLLAFRRPKKSINKLNDCAALNTPNGGTSIDAMSSGICSPGNSAPMNTFSMESPSNDWMTATPTSIPMLTSNQQNNLSNSNVLQQQPNDLFTCNATTNLSNGQVNLREKKTIDFVSIISK